MAVPFLGSPVHAAIKVGVSDWTGWVAWYVAQDQGYFRKYGADVKLVWFANYTDSISALSTGQLDANSQTWSDTLGPLAKGLALKAVLVNDNSAGNDALMVAPKIHGFPELRGHKIALEQYSISHFVLYTALARNGLTPNDVNVVNLSAGDAAAAFMSGRVDAAVVWNPWIAKAKAMATGTAVSTTPAKARSRGFTRWMRGNSATQQSSGAKNKRAALAQVSSPKKRPITITANNPTTPRPSRPSRGTVPFMTSEATKAPTRAPASGIARGPPLA